MKKTTQALSVTLALFLTCSIASAKCGCKQEKVQVYAHPSLMNADATEVKNDKLKNVTVDSVDFLAVLTEDSMKKLNEYEKLSIKLIEENASELKISKLYYQTK